MKAWRLEHIGLENDGLAIAGEDVWKQDWRNVKTETLQLPHPSYPNEIHCYWVYEIGDDARPVRFAAGELSNGVWGFYVPNDPG